MCVVPRAPRRKCLVSNAPAHSLLSIANPSAPPVCRAAPSSTRPTRRFLGVVFQDHQIAGACIAGLCCASIMAFFALKKPYLYAGGNYLSVASYTSLLAAFIGALTEKLEYDEYEGYEFTAHFHQLLFVLWLLPYIVAFADMVNAPAYFMRAVEQCRLQGGLCQSRVKGGRRATVRHEMHGGESKRDERSRRRAKTAFTSDHNRGLHILSTLHSLLPIVRTVGHTASVYAKRVRTKQEQHEQHKAGQQSKKTTHILPEATRAPHRNQPSSPHRQSAWDENNDAAATLAAAEKLDAQLRSMIETFSNPGGNEERFWSHFIEMETAARTLSQIAFPFTDVCHRKAQSAEKGKPGFVRKNFTMRHLLWSQPVTEQLQHVQEETARTNATKKLPKSTSIDEETKAGKDSSGSKERTHPNMHDIATW